MTAANNTFTAIARHNMLYTFAGVAQQFEQAKNRVTQQEQDFNARLVLLSKQLDQASNDSGLDAKHPLAQQFAGLQQNMQQATQCWLADIASQKKGTDFRERLGDSLLVFVYGKVKAGKSSLSNYNGLWSVRSRRRQPAACQRAGAEDDKGGRKQCVY